MRDMGRQETFSSSSNESRVRRLSADTHQPCEVLMTLTFFADIYAVRALLSFLLQMDLSMAAAAELSKPGSRGQEQHKTSLFQSFTGAQVLRKKPSWVTHPWVSTEPQVQHQPIGTQEEQ